MLPAIRGLSYREERREKTVQEGSYAYENHAPILAFVLLKGRGKSERFIGTQDMKELVRLTASCWPAAGGNGEKRGGERGRPVLPR